jgi:hypothetical protein
MLWCTGERKRLLEWVIEEARAVDPDLLVQAAEDQIETAYRRLGLLENA